jgi:uncharacterized membrane protein YeaQ/YmgE (transglycosylase-associated protein family)
MIISITLVTGILLGYVTSTQSPTDGLEDLTRNVVVGMVGAFVGLQVARGIFDSGETGTSVIALALAAIAGASIVLFIVNRVRRA